MEMSASWVTATIEGASREVAIRFGAGHILMARQTGDGRDGAQTPAPLDLLLASLGACTAITLKQYAAARNWSLEVVEVDLEVFSLGGSTSVTRLLSFRGSLDSNQREELLAAADHTPVTLLLAHATRIRTELA